MELSANTNSANFPLCIFCTELLASIKKASGEFINKKVEVFKILSFEFALKRIIKKIIT